MEQNRRMNNNKNQGEEVEEGPLSCVLCLPTDIEFKIMLKMTLKKLKIIYNNKHHQNISYDDRIIKDKVSNIPRLLNILFSKYKIQVKQSKACQHTQLQKLFINRLGCKEEQLELCLNFLCDQIAKRNYQLQLLGSQIRHIERTAKEIRSCHIEENKPSTEGDHLSISMPSIEKVNNIDKQIKEEALDEPLMNMQAQELSIPFQPTYYVWHGFYHQ